MYYHCTGDRGDVNSRASRKNNSRSVSENFSNTCKYLPQSLNVSLLLCLTIRIMPQARKETERSRLEGCLTAIQNRMDAAYEDKLDGKIPEAFWERRAVNGVFKSSK